MILFNFGINSGQSLVSKQKDEMETYKKFN